jgi:TolB-like protein
MRGYFLLRPTFLPFIVINLLLLCFSLEMGIAKVTRVAILPFQTNADENIAYINRGIREMLTARVAYGADIFVVEHRLVKDALSRVLPSELTKQGVQELGSSLGVDYVISGSISKIGNNVSIDISILNVLQGGITKPVFAQSVGLNEVIPKVSSLAQEIVDTISIGFGSPPTETSLQPTGVDETLPEKEPKSSEVVPEKIEEVDLTDEGSALEVPDSPSDEIEMEGKTSDEQSVEPEELEENSSKRKNEINPLDENPVYQKSVNDLDKNTETANDSISEQE